MERAGGELGSDAPVVNTCTTNNRERSRADYLSEVPAHYVIWKESDRLKVDEQRLKAHMKDTETGQ
jgi:hypothetical protein